MDKCAPCGAGTSSEAGAWRCTDCLPGSYATGGEPECLPCAPGSATDKEAQAQCTFCLDGWYANPNPDPNPGPNPNPHPNPNPNPNPNQVRRHRLDRVPHVRHVRSRPADQRRA